MSGAHQERGSAAAGSGEPSAGGHVRALDGIRAVAVMLVLLFHLRFPGFSSGFLGVDIFFVLSGFLITTLLLTEHDRTGRISLSEFWARRARRLLPALVILLLVVAAVTWAQARSRSGRPSAGISSRRPATSPTGISSTRRATSPTSASIPRSSTRGRSRSRSSSICCGRWSWWASPLSRSGDHRSAWRWSPSRDPCSRRCSCGCCGRPGTSIARTWGRMRGSSSRWWGPSEQPSSPCRRVAAGSIGEEASSSPWARWGWSRASSSSPSVPRATPSAGRCSSRWPRCCS